MVVAGARADAAVASGVAVPRVIAPSGEAGQAKRRHSAAKTPGQVTRELPPWTGELLRTPLAATHRESLQHLALKIE